ncbi:DUF7351 domain-containing protein [Natronorubrum halophilum]|uniref:DUF7351 domain-containing protein n=1 Tax=Natronorubrum halophilum TaxID=1702106 RepID=UPI000EF6EFC7|nr:ArsR family transcriptional regulator [Natronorubrum halophilum]
MSAEDVDDADSVPETDWTEQLSAPSDAFQALGNEIRMGILETMLERVDGDGPSRVTFSELFEASEVDTSAGFAYHLEQLVGPYLRKHAEGDENGDSDVTTAGYELTYAGLQIARAIATGTYTHRVDHPPIALEEACPFCGREALEAESTDNIVTVACAGCERRLLALGFPPSGLEAHGRSFPEAFDRHHRHRLALMRDGVCPACAGAVTARVDTPSSAVADELPADHMGHVQAVLECSTCGTEARCPVTLALLEHAAVVSFYRDHDRDVGDRPIWNVGHEWAETVLSEDPLAVRVVVELEDDVLALYVNERLEVVDVQRSSDAEDE